MRCFIDHCLVLNVMFILTIALSVLLLFTAFDYLLGILSEPFLVKKSYHMSSITSFIHWLKKSFTILLF